MNILQQHFTRKKQLFTSFFTFFQQTLKQLSNAVLLEIDSQFFAAKQALVHKSIEGIEKQCVSMRIQESSIIKKILQSIIGLVQKTYLAQMNTNSIVKHYSPALTNTKTEGNHNLSNYKNQHQNLSSPQSIKERNYRSSTKLKLSEHLIQENSQTQTILKNRQIVHQDSSLKQTVEELPKKQSHFVNSNSKNITYEQYKSKFKVSNFESVSSKKGQNFATFNPVNVQKSDQNRHQFANSQIKSKNYNLCERLDEKIHHSALQLLQRSIRRSSVPKSDKKNGQADQSFKNIKIDIIKKSKQFD